MSEYDEIKQRAPILLAASKKLEAYLEAKRFDDYYSEANDLMNNATELIHTYPDTLAAYVVAGNLFQSLIQSSEKYSELTGEDGDVPFVFGNLQFALAAGFLGRNAQDPNVANMLMMVVNGALFTFLEYLGTLDEEAFDDENRSTYFFYIISVAKAAADNLRRFNPASPLLQQVTMFLDQQTQLGAEFQPIDLTELGEIASGLQEFYDKFMN